MGWIFFEKTFMHCSCNETSDEILASRAPSSLFNQSSKASTDQTGFLFIRNKNEIHQNFHDSFQYWILFKNISFSIPESPKNLLPVKGPG